MTDGLGVAASAEEGELGGGGVADVEGNAAVGLLAEGADAAGAEEVGGGVAEGGEVEGLVVGHCALPIGGWWTAGERMVGENGWGVNFGGELGIAFAAWALGNSSGSSGGSAGSGQALGGPQDDRGGAGS